MLSSMSKRYHYRSYSVPLSFALLEFIEFLDQTRQNACTQLGISHVLPPNPWCHQRNVRQLFMHLTKNCWPQGGLYQAPLEFLNYQISHQGRSRWLTKRMVPSMWEITSIWKGNSCLCVTLDSSVGNHQITSPHQPPVVYCSAQCLLTCLVLSYQHNRVLIFTCQIGREQSTCQRTAYRL